MPLSNQKQVMVGMDGMNGRALGGIAHAHKTKVERPIRDAIANAKSNEGLLKRLNGSLLKRMDTSVVAGAAEKVIATSGGIGVVTAAKRIES